MKFKEIKDIIGEKVSTKKLKEIISKISPAEFKKEIGRNGSIINIIKRKIKQS